MDSFQASAIDGAPLAWLFTCTSAGAGALLHGRDVEVFADAFFEGCWASDWPARDADRAGHVFGSGMRLRDGVPCFVTPSHTLEALYICRHPRGWSVSNSLVLLLAHHGLAVPYDPHGGARFASVVRGIDAYEPNLLRCGGAQVSRVIFDNFSIDPAGNLTKSRKRDDLSFGDFPSYRQALLDTLGAAFANAAHSARRARYTPLATCSTGYDSPAVAALARARGCDPVVTLRQARGGDADSGRAVAEALGMSVTEIDRPACADAAQLMAFLASGLGGEDYCYLGFAPLLAGRILLTGFHGDKIWDPAVKPNAVLGRGDVSGSSLQEFRLGAGFLHIPVPMIAGRQHQAIRDIGASQDLRGFSVGGSYDRPIPRRLAEEAGVPRALFGQAKKAASLLLQWDKGARSPQLEAQQRACYRRVCSTPLQRVAYRRRAAIWQLRQLACRLLRKLPPLRPLAARIIPDWRTFEHDHPSRGLLLIVAVDALRTLWNGAAAPDNLQRTIKNKTDSD